MGEVESRFAGSPADEAALRHVAELIREVQPGSMLTGFVLVAQAADADDRWLSCFVMPGQKAWETLGMVAYAHAAEQNAVHVGRDVDDEED